MENKLKNNLSKTEKIIMIIYIIYIAYVKIVYDTFLFSVSFLLLIIYIAARRKSKATDANYLVKEKLELTIRHFILLSIFWNITGGILFGGFVYENTIISIFISGLILVISLLPFSGILKAIANINKMETYKDVKIYRELPQNIEPAIIAHLMQSKSSDKTDLSATLLDLVRRKYLIMEETLENNFEEVRKGNININLRKNSNKDWNKLKKHEKFLVEWLIRISEAYGVIPMSELKNNLKKTETLSEDYNNWLKLVQEEAEKQQFYDEESKLSKFNKMSIKWSKKLVKLSIILLIITTLGVLSEQIITLTDKFYYSIAAIAIINIGISILAVVMYDLRVPETYLNNIGKENIRKWKGFIKFLKEYTLIDKREVKEIVLWEEYLVYGVAFGVADTTIKSMNNAYGLNLDEIY